MKNPQIDTYGAAYMDISLENETQDIYRREIEALIQRDEKYRDLGPAELEAIVRAFELTLTNGREKVRAQMIYDLIHQKRDDWYAVRTDPA